MPLAPGTRLGPHEIIAPAGSGGMGEIYRARDTRLGREVAIKVLPQHLSADPARRERFEREARAVSSLNHPNICVLFDIGAQDGVDYLVMELLEGETVADRLLRGALPMEQVLRHATEIASALARAHRQGIVHRDLKPGNVMLTKSGSKLLDFGLAKLRDGEPDAGAGAAAGASPGGGSMLPTATRNLTTAGTLLGTFQYMAPEQLEGQEVDARTDIFAFGALVYEMASGRRAFEGKSQASLVAAIMGKEPPPLSQVAPLAPVPLDRIVRRCLAKDPDDRWQSASDLAHELREIAGLPAGPAGASSQSDASQAWPRVASSPTGASATTGRRAVSLPIAAALALAAAAASAAAMYFTRPQPAPPPMVRTHVTLPADLGLAAGDGPIAFSPDGTMVVLAPSRDLADRPLHLRRLDSLEMQPLAGTEGATYPFWSPDGRFIGFFAGHKLRKIAPTGGAVFTLCDATDGRGGTWSRDGAIVFSPAPFGPLYRVDQAGGTPTAVTTTAAPAVSHRLPSFLPDGKRLLYFVGTSIKSQDNGIYVLDLESGTSRRLLEGESGGRYAPPGWLVFFRERTLMAQRFDPATIALAGEAAPIAEKVRFSPNRWTGTYTMSDTGLLLYQTGSNAPTGRLAWFDLDGKQIGTLGEQIEGFALRIAPDGRRAAVTQIGSDGRPEIWVYDLARGLGSRLTFGPGAGMHPVFSPDSRSIAFAGANEGKILVASVERSGPPRVVIEQRDVVRMPTSWSPDGRIIVYREQAAGTGWNVNQIDAQGGEPKPLMAGPENEDRGLVSPDGRWLAYVSAESGQRDDLYIVPFADPGGRKYQVTSGGVGGLSQPFAWLSGGRQILYQGGDRRMHVVDVTPEGQGLVIGTPRPVFGDRPAPWQWSVHPDGRRILAILQNEDDQNTPLVLVTDWQAGLAAKD